MSSQSDIQWAKIGKVLAVLAIFPITWAGIQVYDYFAVREVHELSIDGKHVEYLNPPWIDTFATESWQQPIFHSGTRWHLDIENTGKNEISSFKVQVPFSCYFLVRQNGQTVEDAFQDHDNFVVHVVLQSLDNATIDMWTSSPYKEEDEEHIRVVYSNGSSRVSFELSARQKQLIITIVFLSLLLTLVYTIQKISDKRVDKILVAWKEGTDYVEKRYHQQMQELWDTKNKPG